MLPAHGFSFGIILPSMILPIGPLSKSAWATLERGRRIRGQVRFNASARRAERQCRSVLRTVGDCTVACFTETYINNRAWHRTYVLQPNKPAGGLAMVSAYGKVTDEQDRELDKFLASLSQLWEQGEVRPTHRKAPIKARDYRTRQDPFEGEWSQVLAWLEREPDVTANVLFGRLQKESPGKFPDGQLRTLQRRLRGWRQIMAKDLIYHPSEA